MEQVMNVEIYIFSRKKKKKIRDSMKSGAGSDNIYVPCVKLWMDFYVMWRTIKGLHRIVSIL
jgi:hypothetical protein